MFDRTFTASFAMNGSSVSGTGIFGLGTLPLVGHPRETRPGEIVLWSCGHDHSPSDVGEPWPAWYLVVARAAQYFYQSSHLYPRKRDVTLMVSRGGGNYAPASWGEPVPISALAWCRAHSRRLLANQRGAYRRVTDAHAVA